MGADVGQLAELDVGDVGGEGVVDGGSGGGLGHVLDDHLWLPQPPPALPVVALRVGRHLALAFGPEGDQAVDDRRPRRRSGRHAAGAALAGPTETATNRQSASATAPAAAALAAAVIARDASMGSFDAPGPRVAWPPWPSRSSR